MIRKLIAFCPLQTLTHAVENFKDFADEDVIVAAYVLLSGQKTIVQDLIEQNEIFMDSYTEY
jgi:hypothetical protein